MSTYFIHFLSPSSSTFPSKRWVNFNIWSSNSLNFSWSYSFLPLTRSNFLIALLTSARCCFIRSNIYCLKLAESSISASFLDFFSSCEMVAKVSGRALWGERVVEILDFSFFILAIKSSSSFNLLKMSSRLLLWAVSTYWLCLSIL